MGRCRGGDRFSTGTRPTVALQIPVIRQVVFLKNSKSSSTYLYEYVHSTHGTRMYIYIIYRVIYSTLYKYKYDVPLLSYLSVHLHVIFYRHYGNSLYLDTGGF